MRFIVNLRPQMLTAFRSLGIEPHGYLLSAHRVTAAALDNAKEVRKQGISLFADNGTKPLIDEIVQQFNRPALDLRLAIRRLRRALGRIPRGGDVPRALRKRAAALAEDVVAAAVSRSEAVDSNELLRVQLEMNPTDIIAQEDFAVACLLNLGLERETTGWPLDLFTARNLRSLQLWRSVTENPACAGRRVHAVLSAVDYNTARAAGRLAAEAGARFAAIGAASVTMDPSATDFYVIGSTSFTLAPQVPRRYVRFAQIVRGLSDGCHERGARFEGFHCLGLGAPSLLPVAAVGLYAATLVTTDATSPIHDAAKDRVLYDPVRLGDRETTLQIVERILAGDDWPFVSPFAVAFRERFGHDPERARRWWNEQGQPTITNQHLGIPNDLTAALPLFAEADPEVRSIARDTRIAHNHWVLGDIANKRSGADRASIGLRMIDGWLAGPSTVTTRGLSVAKEILQESIAERSIGEPHRQSIHDRRFHIGLRTGGDTLMTVPPQGLRQKINEAHLEGLPNSASVAVLLSPLLEQAVMLNRAISQPKWAEVALLATRCLGFGYGAFRQFQGEAVRMNKLNVISQGTDALISESLSNIARNGTQEQRDAFFGKLRQRLEQSKQQEVIDSLVARFQTQAKERGIPPKLLQNLRSKMVPRNSDPFQREASLEKLRQGKIEGVPLLQALKPEHTLFSDEIVREGLDWAIACLTRGLLATVHAEFNLILPEFQLRAQSLTGPEPQDAFRAVVNEFRAEVRARQLALYGAAATDLSDNDVIRAASALASEIETRLPGLSRVQAAMHVAIQILRKQDNGAAAEEVGRLAVEAGALTREAWASHAASYRLVGELEGPRSHAHVPNLRRAGAVAFDVALPSGTNTPIVRLDKVDDGSFIEVEGFVESVDVRRTADKLIGHLRLVDASQRSSADAVAAFVHLPHVGVTRGAFCRLHGTFRRKSKLFGDKPAVEVDRLPLAELAKQSWRIAFLRSGERWFEAWRNASHLYWSLGPHRAGDTEKDPSFGAAELMFTPFVRNR